MSVILLILLLSITCTVVSTRFPKLESRHLDKIRSRLVQEINFFGVYFFFVSIFVMKRNLFVLISLFICRKVIVRPIAFVEQKRYQP